MKTKLSVILTTIMIVSIVAGRVYTMRMTEGEAFISGWFFWLAAILSGLGALLLCKDS